MAIGIIALAFTSLTYDLGSNTFVYTPKGSTVYVFRRPDILTSDQIAAARKDYKKHIYY